MIKLLRNSSNLSLTWSQHSVGSCFHTSTVTWTRALDSSVPDLYEDWDQVRGSAKKIEKKWKIKTMARKETSNFLGGRLDYLLLCGIMTEKYVFQSGRCKIQNDSVSYLDHFPTTNSWISIQSKSHFTDFDLILIFKATKNLLRERG